MKWIEKKLWISKTKAPGFYAKTGKLLNVLSSRFQSCPVTIAKTVCTEDNVQQIHQFWYKHRYNLLTFCKICCFEIRLCHLPDIHYICILQRPSPLLLTGSHHNIHITFLHCHHMVDFCKILVGLKSDSENWYFSSICRWFSWVGRFIRGKRITEKKTVCLSVLILSASPLVSVV